MNTQTTSEIIYTTDGKCEVFANKTVIARSYLSDKGYEVRILQGMNRTETVAKIIKDCPDFAVENNLTLNTWPKLF